MADLAVVCGATGGLGPAVVAHFISRGDGVLAVAREPEKLSLLRKKLGSGVSTEVLDLADHVSVDSLWSGLAGKPKWLVNLTGGWAGGSVEESDPAEVRAQIDLNLMTAWWSCRAAVPRMKGSGGAIVNVAARAGLVGGAGNAAYAVTKAAVVKLTQVLAEELAQDGVRVNAVAPAIIDSEANRSAFGPKTMAKAVAPEAIAEVIGFLCSDASAPVTGEIVPVYGRYELPS